MSIEVQKIRFRVRRRTAASWTALNEVLLGSEIGHESDTDKLKIGDGTTPWNSLPYLNMGGGGGGPAPVVEMSGVSFTLADLTPGAWHRFTADTQVTITVQENTVAPIVDDAEFGIAPRGAGAVALVAGSEAVSLTPPLGGTLDVEAGGFSVLKKVATNGYEVVGATDAEVQASGVGYDNSQSGLSSSTVQGAIDEIANGGGGAAPVAVMPGTSYALVDLTPGAWHVFTSATGVTLSVPWAAADEPHEFGIEFRGGSTLSVSHPEDVTVLPPRAGSLSLQEGDFCVLKRTSANTYKLVGSTVGV